MRTIWIGVVSRSHVEIGVRSGFIQLNHGKKASLQRLKAGDGLVMYSPRTSHPDGDPLQAFTVKTGEVYQVEMSPDFKPYRVDVQFVKCCELPSSRSSRISPSSKSKTQWGAAFRFGYVKIPQNDFALIAKNMEAEHLAEQVL